jgi:hypothetical protein
MTTSDDIVTRLREFGDSYGLDYEAAAEIERLREDRDRWKDLAVKLLEAHSRILDNE